MRTGRGHTGTGRRRPALAGLLTCIGAFVACDSGTDVQDPDIRLLTTSVTFEDADPRLGGAERPEVVLRNDGGRPLTVSETRILGDSAFRIVEGGAPFTLFPEETRTVVLTFEPPEMGTFTAALDIRSDDPDEATVTVGLTGTGARVPYTQVDRVGAPGLNLLFNHADGVAGFDLAAYNRIAPRDDTLYVDQFEAVLGWFGHPDPVGVTAELLPDALRVDLGAGSVSLATETGRDLGDDALDVMLGRVFGPGRPTSDGVSGNDQPHSSAFPYLAGPHVTTSAGG